MKTLIILHGWQSSSERWQRVKEKLQGEEFRVIVPDLPGFKPETELERAWNLDDYVEWLNNFSQDKGNFFLLGHSFGGRLAIKFANKYSYKLHGLFLVSAAGIKKQKTFYGRILKSGGEVVKGLKIDEMPMTRSIWQLFREFFYRYILRKTDYLRTSGWLKETIKNILEEDLTPLLENIKVPVYIIWGDKDKITPLEDAYLMKKMIKFSQLEILRNVGHKPHMESPDLLVQKIKEILL